MYKIFIHYFTVISDKHDPMAWINGRRTKIALFQSHSTLYCVIIMVSDWGVAGLLCACAYQKES